MESKAASQSARSLGSSLSFPLWELKAKQGQGNYVALEFQEAHGFFFPDHIGVNAIISHEAEQIPVMSNWNDNRRLDTP